jgi:hypothetical protein
MPKTELVFPELDPPPMLPNKGIFSFFLGALLGGIGCSDISFKLGTQMKGILGQMSKNRGKREERREEREN